MKEKHKSISSRFKAHLSIKDGYKGGKSIPTKKNQKTYKLSSNENPIGPSPKAVEAIQQHAQQVHIYPDTTDIRLREALEIYYNNQLRRDQFVCASSGSELIDIIIRGFVNEGDEVIISSPYFVAYKMFAAWSGAKVVDIPLREESNYELDVKGIINAVNDRTRIIFLTSPNNPTGTYIPKATLEVLLAQIPADVVVILDEVYWHFTTKEDYTIALPYLSDYQNLVAINSFSKTYGLAALRVGYAYMNEEIANYLRQLCRPFLIGKLSMEGALGALKDADFINQTVQLVTQERAFLHKQFKALNIKFTPSQANFILIDPPIPSGEFVDFLRERGISVRPVDNFGAPGKVRISIGNIGANKALIGAIKQMKAVKT